MLKLGKLEKVQITAYTNPKRKGKGEVIQFQVNPTQLSSRHENQFSRLKGINTSGRTAAYAKTYSDTLSITLIIDNSITVDNGIGLGPKSKPVNQQVEKFLKTCSRMDGDIHEPRFLRLQWGGLDFSCRLQSTEVKYTRFDKSGNPLRAELDSVFIEDMPDDKRIRLENKKSPDITHTRVIRAGDTLPALCKEIYGNADLFLMVAKANELDHFRRIRPGQDIFFPPIEQ